MASERSELFFFGLIVRKYGVLKMELVDAKKVINVRDGGTLHIRYY